MEYFAGNRGYSRHALQKEINRLLQFFALDDKANELVSNLSRGMQQKVAIAVAMIARTDAILLDEPTLGLDVPASFEVRSLLKAIAYEEGRNIIISTHDMPVVEDVCERVIIVNHGEIVVDDQTSNLLRLFEQHHFDITIAAPLSDVEQQALAHQFGHYEYRSDNQTYTLRIKFKQESDIYQLMDILKSTSIPIITIERKMPRFEDVFVGLLKESVKEPVL